MSSSNSWWREKANQVIRQVILENPDADEKELKKLISQAYPFGERRMWPYKVWLSEVKEVLGVRQATLAVKTYWTDMAKKPTLQ